MATEASSAGTVTVFGSLADSAEKESVGVTGVPRCGVWAVVLLRHPASGARRLGRSLRPPSPRRGSKQEAPAEPRSRTLARR